MVLRGSVGVVACHVRFLDAQAAERRGGVRAVVVDEPRRVDVWRIHAIFHFELAEEWIAGSGIRDRDMACVTSLVALKGYGGREADPARW